MHPPKFGEVADHVLDPMAPQLPELDQEAPVFLSEKSENPCVIWVKHHKNNGTSPWFIKKKIYMILTIPKHPVYANNANIRQCS